MPTTPNRGYTYPSVNDAPNGASQMATLAGDIDDDVQAIVAGTVLAGTLAAYKTATESVTSSTTVQDDNDLTLNVVANGVYDVKLVLIYDALTGGDLKWRLTGPASAAFDGVVHGITFAATGNTDDHAPYTAISQDNSQGGTGAGNTWGTSCLGLLRVAGTAGTFKVQWAQVASSGTATRMFAGSHMILRRIA